MSTSALKHVIKKRTYKERAQPMKRAKLGLLEKHKDYVKRAQDYHKKEQRIKLLQQKAAMKNPDEFNFKMINSQTKEGVHMVGREANKYTQEELLLMKTQDVGYVTMKKNIESNKIARLKSSLHLLDESGSSQNKHTVFVDSDEEADEFSGAKYLNTLPQLLDRKFNRPTLDTLSSTEIALPTDAAVLHEVEKEKAKAYRELVERSEREKKMESMMLEMDLKKQVMGKGRKKKVKGEDGKATFKWFRERKK